MVSINLLYIELILEFMKNVLLSFLLALISISFAGCGETPSPNTNANTSVAEKTCDPINDSPTEAYKRLFAAVKEKNTEKIKGEMSAKTQEFALFLSGQQKQPVEKVYQNGFTGTTFSAALPPIRDERVGGCWAAVEVLREKDEVWEDIGFANEGGKWKLAFGEQFSGAFKSPGKGQSIRDNEASNTARGNVVPVNRMETANTNNVNANVPKYTGPQVEPLPKKK